MVQIRIQKYHDASINEGRQILLPIWKDVDEPMVRSYSPQLSNILAFNAADGPDQLGRSVFQIVEDAKGPNSPFGRSYTRESDES